MVIQAHNGRRVHHLWATYHICSHPVCSWKLTAMSVFISGSCQLMMVDSAHAGKAVSGADWGRRGGSMVPAANHGPTSLPLVDVLPR